MCPTRKASGAAAYRTNLDFSNVVRFGSVRAVVDGRLAVWIGCAACLNPLIVGSRDTSPLAAIFPAYVSVRSRLGVRPSAGPASDSRTAVQAELNARRR